MDYVLQGLDPTRFAALFSLTDAELALRGIRRMTVDQPVGFPCRLTLEDAPVGERVLLLPFMHQEGHSPYRASGPIFVREGVAERRRIVGTLPPYLTKRLLSLRAYDATDGMVDAEVVDGAVAEPVIARLLAREDVSYLHVHYAKRGCYACRVDRAVPAPQ